MNTFAKKLKELRKKNGLSQRILAVAMKVSQSAIHSWECDIHEPSLCKLFELCRFFNVKSDYILGVNDFE